MLQRFADIVGVSKGKLIPRHYKRDAHQRLPQIRQQSCSNGIIRHAQPDRLPFGMHQAPWHLACGLQDKGIGAGRGMAQQSIRRIIHFGVSGDL